jgi:hypothetical protein
MVKMGERVDWKVHKEDLGGKAMDCSTGEVWKVKRVRTGIRE